MRSRLRLLPIDDVTELPTLVNHKAISIDDTSDSPTYVSFETSDTWSPRAILPEGILFSELPTQIIPIIRSTHDAIETESENSSARHYISLLRDLIKNSGLYAIASLVSPLISLVLAPFLTRSLSSADYGALVVLNTTITLLAFITQFGINSAIFRAYNYDYESQRDRLSVLSTATMLLSLTSLLLTIVITMTASWLASLLLGSISFSTPVRIAALVVLMQNLSVPGFAWLRAENRAMLYSILSIANLFIALGMNVILIAVMHLGITGSLLATGAGYGVVAMYTLPLILFRTGFKYRLDIMWNLLSFGIPLVFNNTSYWVLQLSDRYLLGRLGSLAQTASYSIAYNLGGVLSAVIISPFVLAWPTAMFAIAKKKDAPQVFQLVFRWFSMFLLMATFVLALIAVAVLNILFPISYHSVTPIIPIVAASIMLYGVFNIFAVGVGVRRKTWFIALVMTLSALANVGCNFILIPIYGSMGAALSTLIAYAFLTLFMYIVNQCIYPIPFEIGRFITALIVGIALYVGSSLLAQHQTIYGACAIYISSTVLYSSCLVLLARLPIRNHKGR